MDRVDIDTDGDGITDDSFPIDVSDVKPVGWTFKELNETLAPIFKTEPEHTYNLVMALTTALRSTKEEMEEDAVWDLLANRMQGKNIPDDIARRLINSDQSILYYLTLVQDRQIDRLKKSGYKNNSFWRKFNAARSKGDTQAMVKTVAKHFKRADRKKIIMHGRHGCAGKRTGRAWPGTTNGFLPTGDGNRKKRPSAFTWVISTSSVNGSGLTR